MRFRLSLNHIFLFNTLNVLTSLVDLGRNREASVTLGHLETILRATLERDPIGKVALRDELLMVESYLEIQKIRFASRLRTHITSSPEVLRAMVPRFLLQPLVENAIKHGIGTLEEGGAVEATVTRMGNDVLLQVHNDAKRRRFQKRGLWHRASKYARTSGRPLSQLSRIHHSEDTGLVLGHDQNSFRV